MHNKNSFLKDAIDTFQCVRAKLVMFCVNIMSDGVQGAFVLLSVVLTLFYVDGFGHCCAQKHRLFNVLTVCFVDWCGVGANPGHNTGLETTCRNACLVGTQNTSL